MKNKEKLFSVALPSLAIILFFILVSSMASAAPFAYIANGGSRTVSVIDTATDTVTGTVDAGSGPYGVAVSPDGTKVYVTNSANGTVSAIDPLTNKVAANVSVGGDPYGIAITPDGTKVYVAHLFSNTVSVIDTGTNKVTGTIPVGSAPFGIAVNPSGTMVYVVCQYGTVSIIDIATDKVIHTVNVGSQPFGVAFNQSGTKAYVTGINYVSVIDTKQSTIIAQVNVGNYTHGVAFTPDGKKMFLSGGSNTVINTTDNSIIAQIKNTHSLGVSVTPDGKKVYYTNYDDGTVSVVDNATNTIIKTIPVGASPIAFGQFIASAAPIASKGTNLYISNQAPGYKEHGSLMTYSLYYGNTGNSTAHNIVLEDFLPDNVTFVSASDGGVYNSSTRTVRWDIGSVNSTGHGFRIFNVSIPRDVPVGTEIVNKANMTSSDSEIRYDDNEAQAKTRVTGLNLPPNVDIEPNNGGTGTTSVYWKNPITFSYTSMSNALAVYITIKTPDGDICDKMTGGPINWTYTTTLYPHHGYTEVFYDPIYAPQIMNPNNNYKPIANFSAYPDSGYAPLNVTFTDDSLNVTNSTKYIWDFGDGTGNYSTLNITRYTYFKAGNYTVTLYIFNENGNDSISKTITIYPRFYFNITKPKADFAANPSSGNAPLEVQFKDKSLYANEWYWEFGDGSWSTEQDPPHTYDDGGSYTVTLTASNFWGSNSTTRQIDVISTDKSKPEAKFSENLHSGFESLTVDFTDESINATEWKWDFGDGTYSDEQYPDPHTFTYKKDRGNPNQYIVILTAINGTKKSHTYATKTVYTKKPLAYFDASPNSGYAPLTAKFTNKSINSTELSWDFGDGGTSTEQNPSHTYEKEGSYTVTLTASNENGKDTNSQEIIVKKEESVPLYVDPAGYIYDADTGQRISNATVWLQQPDNSGSWINVSTGLNPPISQPDTNPLISDKDGGYQWDTLPGSYRVHVEALGYTPADSIVVSVPPPVTDLAIGLRHIYDPNVLPILPEANFSAYPDSGYAPLAVQFTDQSQNATGWNWDFGDGTTSADRYPGHTYSTPGNYTVELTTSNGNGVDSTTHMITVQEVPIYPVANFTSNVTSGTAPLVVQFNDSSLNADSVTWDFGDGNNSIDRNPVHTYFAAENYKVILTAKNANGTDLYFATINVTSKPALQIFPGCTNLSKDLNGDGLYEDINGNGRLDFADVVTYFNNMAWIPQNEPVTYFDYNHNGRIDFSDVVMLFNMKH